MLIRYNYRVKSLVDQRSIIPDISDVFSSTGMGKHYGLNIDMEVEFMNQHATKDYLPTFFLAKKAPKIELQIINRVLCFRLVHIPY